MALALKSKDRDHDNKRDSPKKKGIPKKRRLDSAGDKPNKVRH